jgi:hypothetical protein
VPGARCWCQFQLEVPGTKYQGQEVGCWHWHALPCRRAPERGRGGVGAVYLLSAVRIYVPAKWSHQGPAATAAPPRTVGPHTEAPPTVAPTTSLTATTRASFFVIINL